MSDTKYDELRKGGWSWRASGNTSYNNLVDKPIYTIITKGDTVVSPVTVTSDGLNRSVTFSKVPVDGSKYIVVWNDDEYICTATNNMDIIEESSRPYIGSNFMFGSSDASFDDYPFMIQCTIDIYNEATVSVYFDTSTRSSTFSIYEVNEQTVMKLNGNEHRIAVGADGALIATEITE